MNPFEQAMLELYLQNSGVSPNGAYLQILAMIDSKSQVFPGIGKSLGCLARFVAHGGCLA